MDNGKPREGQLCRLVIDGYASDGAGVARLDGMVVFVQGGIRGEACDVRLTHVGRSALWGRVEEVVNPSPARIFPRCLHYTKCGGCQFRHMNYAEELEAKRIRVEDALRRLGGAEIHVSAILGAEQVDRYRNKAQFPVAKGPRIGFYRPRSHDVIDVDDCLLQGEAAARLRGAVRSAVLYPLILILLMAAVIAVLVVAVMPIFQSSLFRSFMNAPTRSRMTPKY